MYIDTSTKKSIKESVLDILDINNDELYSLLEDCYQQFQVDHQIFMLDEQYDFFYAYATEHVHKVIDEAMFIHLSRRIDNGDDNGYGLIEMLTNDHSLSSFFNEYGIIFKYEDNQLKFFVDKQEVIIEDENSYGYRNFQQKINLHYDLEFSGYMLKDEIEKIREYCVHEEGSSIFDILYLLGVDDDVITDAFAERSDFCQLEYIVPLTEVSFDDYDDLDEHEKPYHIIAKTLQRLYSYKYDKDFIGDDCSVIRMKDNQIMNAKYLSNKIKIED